MSEELENSVREMLKAETWTRAGISNFTMNNLAELGETLDKARAAGCEYAVKDICDEQLSHTKESIVALYLSGMIALRTGSIDLSSLSTLFDIFEKNHKEALSEYLCEKILADDPQNKLALRKQADLYKASNNDKVWDLYEKIVKLDFEEADIAKVLAERYAEQGNRETSISYYKKALLRYVAAKNFNMAKPVWSILVAEIPEEIDFFLLVQRKVAKTISGDKSAVLMQEIYNYYKDTAKWDVAIDILKLILEIDSKDSWARKEIVDCFRGKYADHSHLEDFIKSSNLNQSFRNVFEAIGDFEKHIAFDAKNYVFHRTWGVGIITKVIDDTLTINFGKKTGVHSMSLKMAVSALTPLEKDHIWVLKKTIKHEELAKKVKAEVEWTLKTVIRSFGNKCDDKRIKAEIVPSILTPGEWTSWHSKAQNVMTSNPVFGVDPNDVNLWTVRDRELTREERLANEFKADKQFFSRVDIMYRYLKEIDDPSDEQFSDMFAYFAGYLKAASSVNEQLVASFLVVQEVLRRIPSLENPAKFTFAQLYGDIEKPSEMYTLLKDTKNTTLKQSFIANIRMLPDWDDQYIALFPTVLDSRMIDELISAERQDKVVRLVQNCYSEYRANRNAVIYLSGDCRDSQWFKDSAVAEDKQLVTLVNIISVCFREINNHVNTVENKKTIKNATALLFAKKVNGELKNPMLEYMLANGPEVTTRMYTMVNDVRDLDSTYKAQLRNGILSKFPDFKFQEAEIKQEAPKGLMVTAKKLEEKRALAEDIEKVQLPKVAQEIAEAKEKGDLKENAEYISAREAQHRLNETLGRLKAELAKAVVFDPTTVATSMVSFGVTATFQDNINGKEVSYTILGPWESNVDEGIISYLSPLGNSVLDMKLNEQKAFAINGNKYDFTVKSIVPARM